jgi:hypothetical protein
MDVYQVTYETSWNNSEFMEEDSKRVATEDAEAAIAKVKEMVLNETITDEDCTAKRDSFKLLSVEFVTDFEK